MNRQWLHCTVLVLGAFYINTLVLIVTLKICSTRRRGVPTLGEFISTTTTTKATKIRIQSSTVQMDGLMNHKKDG